MRALIRSRRFATLFAVFAVLTPATAVGATFTNSTAIPIGPGPGPSSLYPSPITPGAGLTGSAISGVTVTVHALEHAFLSDIDILLVAPNGTAVVLMSDACTFFQTTAATDLTFDDAAPAPIAPSACFVIPDPSKPINHAGDNPQFGCEVDPDMFPAPAPPGPGPGYATGPQLLSSFNGMTAAVASGTWNLWVKDDCDTEGGQLGGGWSLNLLGPTVVTVLSFSARPTAGRVALSWKTATNGGILGFNVFRNGPQRTVKVNKRLVAAAGVFGGNYRFVDRTARAGVKYTYRLQVVHQDGRRTWDGSARVTGRA